MYVYLLRPVTTLQYFFSCIFYVTKIYALITEYNFYETYWMISNWKIMGILRHAWITNLKLTCKPVFKAELYIIIPNTCAVFPLILSFSDGHVPFCKILYLIVNQQVSIVYCLAFQNFLFKTWIPVFSFVQLFFLTTYFDNANRLSSEHHLS